MLADKFHVIAPDYVGFGYSDMPLVNEFEYTFDNLAAHVEELLLSKLGLKKFSIYVQDYGAPIGYRIASKNPGRSKESSFKTETPTRRESVRVSTRSNPSGKIAMPKPRRRCERC
jgi:pimeloyl-ACP methyl ester carboxylesterase